MVDDTTSLDPPTCTSLPRSTLYTTTSSQRSRQSRPHAGQICHDTPFPFQSQTSASIYCNLILCDPTGVDPLTYALPPPMPPLVPLPKTSSKCSKNRNHNAGTCHDSPIPISLTNTYSLTLRNTTGVISSHTSPTHNTYSLILVSQPASISPHTLCLSSFPSPTLCVGVGAWNSW